MRFLIALTLLLVALLLAAAPAAASPVAPFPIWSVFGQHASRYGESVSGVGDVNGDGYDDIVVGAIFFDNDQNDEGGAWLYLGAAAGPDTAADWHVEGNQQNAQLGYAVAGAGDVNQDGFDDLLVGIPGRDRVHLYLGSPAGPSVSPSWIATGCCTYGASVAAAGDINADGFDDVVIGAMNGGTLGEGIAQVFHGSATGLGPTPAWTGEGNQDFARYGYSVSGAGDVNDDGFDDIVIGATDYDHGEIDEGRVFVYHGSAAGLATAPAWTAEVNQPDTYFGFSVAGAGDVNADGFGDVIAGAIWWSQGVFNDDGLASVYLGSAGGLAAEPVFTTYGLNAEMGFSVDSAGDLNRDGFDDVVVGAPHYRDPEALEGAALVFLGSPGGPSPTPDWIGQLNLAIAHMAQSVAGAGDVNGDTYDDLIVGLPFPHCPVFPPCGPIPALAVVYLGQATTTGGPPDAPSVPAQLGLTISPNPFARSTAIEYALWSPAAVTLEIYDASGRARVSLVDATQTAGRHTTSFHGEDGAGQSLPPGVYFLRLAAGSEVAVTKLVMAR
jgi:hypothetical protein